ncbi:hypothetical protein [Nocardioides piscis]|uniref:Uncharacterized protein n=1 Tax=Nocardioides piscis TaxID=2714938 RepID=A0A6G7YGX5_9ACTN|nr:hypothetical protein [Nocardioides piscis]QIK76062.1 hypothetical protein G7071_12115 [Nocardioides piscis]
MSAWLKTLLVLALIVPMTAYVVGSLVASGSGQPADRGPVIIRDAPSSAPPRPDDVRVERREDVNDRAASPRPARPTSGGDDDADDGVPADDDRNDRNEGKARVVTPQPTSVDDDDDDGVDDDSDDDSHDTDDGDDDEEPERDDDEGDD